ncbi:MAG TPA: ABC transporter permease [Myxococcaceae bacterium]|nr:ABC transporter permease [Myxococcaceae bacterium]
MINAFNALMWNGFREARRNRITVIVAAFAVALVLSSSLIAETAVATLDRVVVDVGLGSMSIMLVVLSIFLSSGMLSREIERRTIFLVTPKPISRGLFLLARLAGNMVTLGVLLLAMAALFCLQLLMYRTPLAAEQFVAIGMLWVELLVLSSVGFAMASFSGQIVSAVVTAGVYIAGHLSRDIYSLAMKSKQPLLKLLGQGVYYVLPNLERLNYRPQATYSIAPVSSEILGSIVYAVAYSGALLAIAILIFNRRDFK